MALNMFSSEEIEKEVLPIPYEPPPYEYFFEIKLQANFDKSNQNFD